MANKVTTVFDAETRGFRQGVQRIKQDIAGAEGAVGKLKAGWKGATEEFKTSRAAQAAAAGIALKVAQESIQAASNLEESVNAVTVSYGDQSDAVLKLGEDSVDSYGLSQRALNEFTVQFSAFSKQIAQQDGRAVVDVVDEIATRVADFASVHNLSLEEASRVARSTLAGETESFRRYGGDVSAATVKTHAYATGIAEVGTELTEQQKVLARYSLFMEQTNTVAGDFENTSDGLANQTKKLSANIEDLSASFGEHLIPAAQEGVGTLNDLIEVAERLKLLDLAAEADKYNHFRDPVGTFRNLEQAASDVVFKLDDFKGTSEELRRELESLGIGTDEIAAAVEHYESTQSAATEATELGTAAAAAEAEAKREQANELDAFTIKQWQAQKATEAVGESADDTADSVEDLTDEVESLTDTFSDLIDEVDDRSAWRNLQDSFDNIADAKKRAEEAADTFGDESREAERAARDEAQAIDDLRVDVIKYGDELENIPPAIVSEIQALIDAGQLAEAEAALANLTRNRTTFVNIQTRGGSPGVSITPSSGGGGTKKIFGAAGGVINRPTELIAGEAGPEALIPLDKSPGNGPLPAGIGGGISIHIERIETAANNGQQLYDELAATIRRQGPGGLRRALGID